MGFKNSQRGQFFSPDLIIAIGVFLFGMAFFWAASNSVFAQTDLLNQRKQADEVAHMVLNDLVFSSGEPQNWPGVGLSDINAFGLAKGANVLDREKTVALANYLNSPAQYTSAKERMGFGPYDFRFRLLGPDGKVISDGIALEGGRVASSPKISLVYQRVVEYNSKRAVLEGTVSLAQ